MAPSPDDRFPSAGALARATQSFLDGRRRRAAALERVAQARDTWARYQELAPRRRALVALEAELAGRLPAWAPLSEKAELIDVRDQIAGFGAQRARLFAEALSYCDHALSRDPSNVETRASLASMHFARFEAAEAARDEEARLFHEDRVRQYDDGRHAALLRGVGAVHLRTDPAGAEVYCERYAQRGLVWRLVEGRRLGATPLEGAPLEQGSYLLTIRAPGRRDTLYPVFIHRGRVWDSGAMPVRLFTEAEIGTDCVYVPAGPFLCGADDPGLQALPRAEEWLDGFFVQRWPVTMEAYCDFLNAVAETDPEAAWSRVPRDQRGLSQKGGQFWSRPHAGVRYEVPEVDRDGDPWDPQWPVCNVSWHDARAFAEWRASEEARPWGLPTERRWEKAARGVDGRLYPWGDGFDATLCRMRVSRPERPQPAPVGHVAQDRSPYGVGDLAGSVRDWCADMSFNGDPKRRPVRGGSWVGPAEDCVAFARRGVEPWITGSMNGFRLARTAAEGDPPR